MWLAEAVVRLRRATPDGDDVLSLGGTSAPAAVQAVLRQLLIDAERGAEAWAQGDALLGALAEAEHQKLARVVEALAPDVEGGLFLVDKEPA